VNRRLSEYEEIVGRAVMEELWVVAEKVRHRCLQNINSTPVGGGVAELLTRIVPLLRELGVDARWDVIKGGQAFFEVTKAFHNALHGSKEPITEKMFETFRAANEANLREMRFTGDVVLIHDPQPAGLVQRRKEIGRSHQTRWCGTS